MYVGVERRANNKWAVRICWALGSPELFVDESVELEMPEGDEGGGS